MTRLTEKLRLSFYIPTRFLSLLSLSSTLNLCKSIARFLHSQTLLPFFSMDNNLFSDNDYFSDDLDSSSYSLRLNRRLPDSDHLNFALDRVYLLPYRWWIDAEGEGDDRVEGVLYTVSSNDDSESEILLHLKKEEDSEKIKSLEAGFSGRHYALVPEGVWLRALKRYNDFNNAAKDFGRLFYAEDCLPDLFPLQLRIFVSWETSSLVAKISEKENVSDFYKKASDIFNSAYDSLYIWDFSGQTTQLLLNDKARVPNDSSGQPGKEVLLELQVHGLADSMKGSQSNGMITDRSEMECTSNGDPVTMNGSTGDVIPYVTANNYFQGSSYRAVRSLGLTGLHNLGNTCFMNSAIQCLAHTPKLVDFFLGDYRREINYENPLGMNGELALSFGDLLRQLWVPGASPLAPKMFKMKLANFAPQFSGYMQHDSQELLAFLLDGLHEDLNRVKRKPYHEVKDADGRPDGEVAEEYWRNHLARNDSIVVDSFQGQFRSTLICPFCKKVSITFDPFMYLSLPLPSTTTRTMTVTVISTDGVTLPSAITVTVPKSGTLKDLIGALAASCSLRDDETLLVAEIYKNRIFRGLDDKLFMSPSDSLADIRDQDKLVAYRVQKYTEDSPVVVFMHEHVVEIYKGRFEGSIFGFPLVARLSDIFCRDDLRREFLNLMNPFLMQNSEETIDEYDKDEDVDGDDTKKLNEVDELGETNNFEAIESDAVSNSGAEDDIHLWTDFEFYLLLPGRGETCKITSKEPLPAAMLSGNLEVAVVWSDKMLKKYDTNLRDSLPQVFRPQLFTKRTQESISIYKCLEAFLREEPLGPEDMWYCPTCKKHQQATKKLDLWRLPEILVVHLKRFSYNRFFKNKLETFVDFPTNDLDLSTYVAHQTCSSPNCYMLYAIICHYGGLGGGHYTAFVRYGHDKWYEFDDSRVAPADEETIKTPAAYVLFYKKV